MTEPAFVKFPKRLFDAILASPMPAGHKVVTFAVLRWTIGHHQGERPNDAAGIGIGFLKEITGRERKNLSRARQNLTREGVLCQLAASTYYAAAVFYVNPDPSLWGAYSPAPGSLCREAANRQQVAKEDESGGKPTGGEMAKLGKSGGESTPIEERKLIENPNGSPPAGGPQGPSGGSLQDAPATPEQINEILTRHGWKNDERP